MFLYTVYIQVDEQDNIILITGSITPKYDNWIEIDKGYGEKYSNPLDHYFKKGLIDKNGIYNYRYIDNTIIERTDEGKQLELDKIRYRDEIMKLKNKLIETDYITIKIAEGVAIKEEYADVLALRNNWRERINQLETLI